MAAYERVALRAVLAERGITEYAVVDHGHDMAAAVDIPLRLAVIATDDGASEIVLRDMASLLHGAAGPLAGGFTDVLRGLAEATRGRLVPVESGAG
jgi:hypothetical protein